MTGESNSNSSCSANPQISEILTNMTKPNENWKSIQKISICAIVIEKRKKQMEKRNLSETIDWDWTTQSWGWERDEFI